MAKNAKSGKGSAHAKPKGKARGSKPAKKASAYSQAQAKLDAQNGSGDVPQAALNLPKPRDLKHHYSTIMGFKAKLDEASGNYRNALKQAKEAGIDTAAIKATMKWSRKDELDTKLHFSQLAALFKENGMPIQFALFEPKFGSAEEEAAHKGRKHAEAGGFAESPYPDGSAPDVAYRKAFDEVTASRVPGAQPQQEGAVH